MPNKKIRRKEVALFFRFFISFFLGFLTFSYAQENNSSQGNPGSAVINNLIKKHAYKEAVKTIQKQIDYYSSNETTEQLVWYYHQLAVCNLKLELFEEAKIALDYARSIEKKELGIADILSQLQLSYGDYYLQTSENDLSLDYFLKFRNGVGLASRMDTLNLTKVFTKLATVYQAKNEFEIAYKYLDSVEIIINTTTNMPHYLKAEYYKLKGFNFQKEREEEIGISFYLLALDELESEEYKNQIAIAKVAGSIGESYYFQYDYEQAMKFLKRSSELYVMHLGENAIGLSSNYSVMARIYSKSGQFKSAQEYNKKNLAISKSKHGTQSWQVGLAYAIMGITYGRMDDYNSALSYFEKANTKFILNFGREHRWVVTTFENIGRAHNRLGNYQKSLANYEKAIGLGRQTLGADHIIVAHVYLNAADTYAALKKNEKAILLYEKALEINIRKYGNKHREVAQNYVGLGNFYHEINDYENAILNYDTVIEMYKSEIKTTLNAKMAEVEFIILYKILGALEGKGKSSLSRYLKNNSISDLLASKKAYEQADNILEKMRRGVSNYEDKIEIAEENQNGPIGAMETNYLLYKVKGNPKDLEQAFYFSEKNRAAALEQLLAKSNQKMTKGIFKATIKKDQGFKKKRSNYLSEIKNLEDIKTISREDSLLIISKHSELFKVNKSIDSLQLRIKEEYPSYYAISHEKHLISIQEIQEKLDDKTTLVEYFQRDSSITYAFVITSKTYAVEALKTEDLEKQIQGFKQGVLDKDIVKYRNNSYQLYRQLLAPLSKHFIADELILIPHGDLWQLNFDLLLTEEHEGNNPKLMPYALRKYVISYANSANTLFQYNKIDPTADKECLAFSFANANSNSESTSMSFKTLRNSKAALPGTSKEIKAISDVMKGDYFYGVGANERLFKEKASHYAILHLALHGEVDDKNSENSRLLFSTQQDSVEDNILYSHELFTMHIPAQLVVLSACNSGAGKITSGEGIMSIGNAFQYAGTNSLLMTQWEISDKVAPLIMEEFYKNLKKGMRKSRALQQAKLSYIKEADALRTSPFYWGSFYLVGDVTPLFLETSFSWLYYLLGVVTLLSIFLFARIPSKS